MDTGEIFFCVALKGLQLVVVEGNMRTKLLLYLTLFFYFLLYLCVFSLFPSHFERNGQVWLFQAASNVYRNHRWFMQACMCLCFVRDNPATSHCSYSEDLLRKVFSRSFTLSHTCLKEKQSCKPVSAFAVAA